jgi:putative radical SAM enzyme (TIGR03279 family)
MKACSSAADGVVVAEVRRRTAAAVAGLAAGDRVLAINGQPLRDAIDFQFHAADEQLDLDVERGGARTTVTVIRRAGELGVELVPPTPSEIATCANKCVFCFIHQLPKGMRRSLYVKDDDFRLSFLHGNYITLTDLDEAVFRRIIEQRLSPLYVSVHATDPALRHALLGKPRLSADILPPLQRLAGAGIRIHAQIVLCPGLNDGAQLERTVFDLAPLSPQVATTAIVPVGLTRHRERLPALRPLRDDEARELVTTVTAWQKRFLGELGSRFVFLGDEVYLQAAAPLPTADAYEGFAIAEDGVGLVRRFEDDFERSLVRRRGRGPERRRRITVVTGEMYGGRLASLLRRAGFGPETARVVAVPNDFFGRGIAVAGLLTGRDIQRHLAGLADLGEVVLVPAVAVHERDRVFLDDQTPEDLARDLGVPVRTVAPTASALLDACHRA